MKFVIDGCVIEADACHHCGAVPTENDAREVLEKTIQETCVFCKTTILPAFVRLDHFMAKWTIASNKTPSVWLATEEPDGSRKYYRAHQACWDRFKPQ